MPRTKNSARKTKGGKAPKKQMIETAAHMAKMLDQIELDSAAEVKEVGAENKNDRKEDKDDDTSNYKSTGKRAIEEVKHSDAASASSSALQEEIKVEEESSNKQPVEVAEGKVAEDDDEDDDDEDEDEDDHKEKKQTR